MERRLRLGRPAAAAIPVLVCGLLLAGLLMPALAPAGTGEGAKGGQSAPKLDARAWVVIDARDGDELAGHDVSSTVPIASTTKLMTAYLTLHHLPLSKVVRAPGYSPVPGESVLGLQKGERMSVRDLFTAMMLPSANDAAYALAENVSGSVPAFVRAMNREAEKLDLDDTSYDTPIGLDDPKNGSSARDLAALARILMRDPRFRRIVAKSEATLQTGAMPRTIETRNTLMLSDPSVDGIKTGHTLDAGYVLVASAEREGTRLISVVLGAPSEATRDSDSEQLLDYGFSMYHKRTAVDRGQRLGSVPVAEGEPASLPLRAGRSMRAVARDGQDFDVDLDAPASVDGPIAAGSRIGSAAVTLEGRRIGTVPVLAGVSIAKRSTIDKLGGPVAALLIAGGSILLLIALAVALRRKGAA